jgi:polyisoprenoid-binding protein YceI
MKTTMMGFIIFCLISSFTMKVPVETTYMVDTGKSTLHWAGYPLFNFGEHNGTLTLRKGEIKTANGELTGGSFEIDMTSMRNLDMKADDGGNDLVKHLKSDDFFSVEKFPAAYFKIIKTKKTENARPGEPNVELTGELTIKDVKNTLTFPAIVSVSGNTVKATAKFKFDRTRWGIRYESGKFFDNVGDAAISDAVGIELNIVATK